MKSKIILGTVIATVIAVSMIMTPAFAASPLPYLQITNSVIGSDSVKITTAAPVASGIPNPYGYGVITGNGVLAVTTHKGINDSIRQADSASAVFHTHFVTLKSTGDCASGLAVATITDNQVGDLKISGNSISVTNVDTSTTGTLNGPTVSFALTIENGNVCVNLASVFP